MASRGRSSGRSGRRQLAVLFLVLLVILGVTFLLGFLVGRHSSRNQQREVAVEKEKRPPQPKGGGLRDRELERLPQVQEKLTFYHTLTAPGSSWKEPAPKGSTTAAGSSGAETRQRVPRENTGTADVPQGSAATPGEASATSQSWTVQVAAYRSRDLALALQRSLVASGYDSYVSEVAGPGGEVRYRVRVGQYPSRGDAEKVSDRLRGERAVSPLVIPR